MNRRLSRIPRSILLLGILASLVFFPLVFLTIGGKGSAEGGLLDLRRLRGGGRMSSPSAMVLKGTKEGEGLDWPGRLLKDQFYFTAGNLGGVTNQVMCLATSSPNHSFSFQPNVFTDVSLAPVPPQAIYIALLTSRIPILPPIYPYAPQLGADLVTYPLLDMPFSSIFDLPRLFEYLHQEYGLAGIIEWTELVNVTNGVDPQSFNTTTDFSCWSAHTPGLHDPLNRLRIRPTFANLPPLALRARPEISIPTLTSYLHPKSPIIQPYLQALNNTVPVLPSTHLTCIDNAYYASNDLFVSSEWAGQGGKEVGAWWVVGRHMDWTPELKARGELVARWIFGVSDWGGPVEFIAAHVRHGDFLKFWPPPPTSNLNITQQSWSAAQYAFAVDTLRATIFQETGKLVEDVLFTTDEQDPEFLRALTVRRGWKTVDEEMSLRIRREWGDWYPTLIDNVLLSMGRGFVGTAASTMSIVNARRVEDWNEALPSIYVHNYSPVGDFLG